MLDRFVVSHYQSHNKSIIQAYNGLIISNATSTAVQSTINGDSFTESLKHQAINTIVMTGADYGANKIGNAYHTNKLNLGIDGTTGVIINKTIQLGLHAGLGAITNTLTGNDALSGAVSGVVGEVLTGWVFDSLNNKYTDENGLILKDRFETNREIAFESGGLFAGISSLLVGQAKGLDTSDIRDNVYAGYRVGKNAGENNSTFVKPKLDKNGNVINDKYVVVDAKKDGDKGIYDVTKNNEKIGETVFDNTFRKYDSNGIDIGPAYNNTINFDKDITDLMNLKVDEANSELTLYWGYESRKYGKYDLKNILSERNISGHYDGYVYNGQIVTARGAGNILFGRNMENSEMASNFAIKVAAGGYQFLKDDRINFIDYTKNNNWLRDLGETHEAVRYYNFGIEEQYRKNYDKNPKMENLRQIIKHRGF